MLNKSILFSFAFFLTTLHAKEAQICSNNSSDEKKYEVLTLGAAIADYFIPISEQDFQQLGLEKGGWQPVSEEEWQTIYKSNKDTSSMMPGGSAINVIKGLAHLGVKCACLGKIGSDDVADAYLKRLQELGIHAILQKGSLPTGKMICFVTEDGQRTMRTCMGASHALGDMEINADDFKNIKLFHMEGYQMVDQELMHKAFAMAKKSGAKISMDLGNSTLVRKYKKELEEYLKQYVDIVFANDDEARTLTGLEPMHACNYLATICDIAVVTMGKNGGWVKRGKEQYYFPAVHTDIVKDTTVAGDLFASGFLLGILKGRPLKECAWMGAYVASHVVRVMGADLPDDAWLELNARIKCEEAMANGENLPSKRRSLKETAKTHLDAPRETDTLAPLPQGRF